MKKIISLLIIAVLLCLCACNPAVPEKTGEGEPVPNVESTGPTENSTTEIPSETTDPVQANQLPLPKDGVEFTFLSGAGAWRTVITLNQNGKFTGQYLDSEMGDVGKNHPHGSAYVCDFSGKFSDIKKIDKYSYRMTLTDIETEKTVGDEWIEDKIRYIAALPHGLNDPDKQQSCTEFILYLPDTPVDQVPEEFLTWWPYRTASKTTLSCYGILNVATNYGFFHAE